jgi:hypothetical protein
VVRLAGPARMHGQASPCKGSGDSIPAREEDPSHGMTGPGYAADRGKELFPTLGGKVSHLSHPYLSSHVDAFSSIGSRSSSPIKI